MIANFFANLSGYIVLLIIGVWLALNLKKHVQSALAMGAAALLSRGIITEAIRFFWNVPRPLGGGGSFPSGHAAFYFAIATALYFYNKKLGILAFAVSIAMGFSRVFLRYHWPLDIAGGAVIGIASGFLVVKLAEKFYAQRT